MTTKEIKTMLREIKTVKANLAAQIEQIREDEYLSDSYKKYKEDEAQEAALAALAKIHARSDGITEYLAAEIKKSSAFDYKNPELVSALQFIQTVGAKMPAPAWKQMIEDFKDKPNELRFLRDMFQENGAIDAAVEANEYVKVNMSFENLPDRVSDAIFYACNDTRDTDFSKIETALDALDEAASAAEPSRGE